MHCDHEHLDKLTDMYDRCMVCGEVIYNGHREIIKEGDNNDY